MNTVELKNIVTLQNCSIMTTDYNIRMTALALETESLKYYGNMTTYYEKKRTTHLYFTLVQLLIVLISYEYIYQYSEAHHSSFASSPIDMIPLSIWIVIGAQFCISIYTLLQQENHK